MDPLILYVDGFWNSPYAFSVFVCLTEKGLPFETREVNLHERAQTTPEFRARSVTARVPLLEHGSFRLTESSAIVEYLDETFPPPRVRRGDAGRTHGSRSGAPNHGLDPQRSDGDP